MKVSAWKAATYGIRLSKADVKKYFQQGATTVQIEINGVFHTFDLSQKFWSSCPEIRGKAILGWMSQNMCSSWTKGQPPKFNLVPLGGNKFRLSK